VKNQNIQDIAANSEVNKISHCRMNGCYCNKLVRPKSKGYRDESIQKHQKSIKIIKGGELIVLWAQNKENFM